MSNTEIGQRTIRQIAFEIRELWVDKQGRSKVNFGAVPYLSAMAQLETIDEAYHFDTATSVVLYFLSNAQTWRGPDARRIKAELKGMLK